MALDGFSSQDKARITNALRLFEDPDKTEVLRSKTAKLPTSEPMYILRAAPAIRLIYRTTPDGIEILDVVKKATLHAFLDKNVETAVTAKSRSSKSATSADKAKPPKSKPIKPSRQTYSTKLEKKPN
jgi:hypothetical protein